MTSAPSCSVVICAYTERRWLSLAAAIDSVRRQTSPPAEIIVVADHNASLARRAAASFDGVTVIANSASRGLSGARNTGVGASHGDVVAFLDDDAEAEADWIATLLRWYRDEDVIAVGGSVAARWIATRPHWLPEEFGWVVGCSYTGVPEIAAPVRNLLGANMSFRRDVFSRAGGFRSGIGRIGAAPFGCEETEFCIRARRAYPGAAIIYDPGARVAHAVTPERASWRYFRARCYAEGLSKAAVARIVGADAALASERRYVRETITAALVRYTREAIARRDLAAGGRCVAVVVGLLLTCAGFASGVLRRRSSAYDVGVAAEVA